MTNGLDVLLIESQPGDGVVDAELLEAAGHRVHRCRPDRSRSTGRQSQRERFLCSAVVSGTCPLQSNIDVVLLVRGRVATCPTTYETGVSCALRAGIPVVEDGPELLDPYAPWITVRAGDDVLAACEEAARLGAPSAPPDQR